MQSEIVEFDSLKCYGIFKSMSLKEDQTRSLWVEAMSVMLNAADFKEAYSLQEYPADFFQAYDPNKEFRKWALVEAKCFKYKPEGFKEFEIPAGRYARFFLEDRRSGGLFFSRVFSEYLPAAGLHLRQAPHFEVLARNWLENQNLGEWVYLPIHYNR
jgi:AraC family transcriptional regulator